jgi:hypothetical protein
VLTIAERSDTMKRESCRTAEHDHIAMLKLHFDGSASASRTTKSEHDWQSERHRDNRLGEISFVSILVHAHLAAN